eukprot:14061746-Heterocapsa_arctica.AAC.1
MGAKGSWGHLHAAWATRETNSASLRTARSLQNQLYRFLRWQCSIVVGTAWFLGAGSCPYNPTYRCLSLHLSLTFGN